MPKVTQQSQELNIGSCVPQPLNSCLLSADNKKGEETFQLRMETRLGHPDLGLGRRKSSLPGIQTPYQLSLCLEWRVGISRAPFSMLAPSFYHSFCPPLPIPPGLFPCLPMLVCHPAPQSCPSTCLSWWAPSRQTCSMSQMPRTDSKPIALSSLLFSRHPTPHPSSALSPRCLHPGLPQIKTCVEHLLNARLRPKN